LRNTFKLSSTKNIQCCFKDTALENVIHLFNFLHNQKEFALRTPFYELLCNKNINIPKLILFYGYDKSRTGFISIPTYYYTCFQRIMTPPKPFETPNFPYVLTHRDDTLIPTYKICYNLSNLYRKNVNFGCKYKNSLHNLRCFFFTKQFVYHKLFNKLYKLVQLICNIYYSIPNIIYHNIFLLLKILE